ncbi:MAG: alcohol dehydrogenase [Mucilaginibacter sp.]|nr:alcohol dehydrogenase [Mucilaginibacter sp.]
MKAWELQGFGIQHLKQVVRELPIPGPRQILVKVSAVALNYRDKAIMEGFYLPDIMKMPIIPVSDTAGVVVQAGNEITKFKLGDRVISHLYPTWVSGLRHPSDVSHHALGGPVDGGLAEYILLDESGAVKTPDSLTDAEASTLPIAALTAWFALVEHGQLKSGQTVVSQGTGGVALFTTQFAAALGARVIALSSSEEKLGLLKQLGASDTINYRENPDWHKQVIELTGGHGADNIIDVAGGSSLNKSVQAITDGGQVSVVGFLENITASLDLLPVVFKAAQVRGILVGNLDAFTNMISFIGKHEIKPIIETIYSFDDALAAYQHLERGAIGKIVISIS